MLFSTNRKRFRDLSEQEIIALAISSEEDTRSVTCEGQAEEGYTIMDLGYEGLNLEPSRPKKHY